MTRQSTMSLSDESSMATHASLLERLRDWRDEAGWREFFDRYWKLIYAMARRAGLTDSEAQDVVQETFLALAKKLPGFRYDPGRGRFRTWLRLNVRSRLVEHWRRRPRDADGRGWEGAPDGASDADAGATDSLANIPDAATDWDRSWDREWELNLVRTAGERVKQRVNPRHFAIYELIAIQGVPLASVARSFDVSRAHIYLIRHRVGRLMKRELAVLRDEAGDGPDGAASS